MYGSPQQVALHKREAEHLMKKVSRNMLNPEKIRQVIDSASTTVRVTTAILLSLHLDPRDYHCAQSYLKALGLNLKEKSSGRYVRQRNSGMKTRRHPKPKTRRLSPSCASWLAGSGMWLEAKLTRRPNCLMCRVKRHKSTTN